MKKAPLVLPVRNRRKTQDKEAREKMDVHFESSRSEQESDRERLGMDGMMIYSILRDARTLSTVEILLFLSYSVALFKTSDTKPKVYSANCFTGT